MSRVRTPTRVDPSFPNCHWIYGPRLRLAVVHHAPRPPFLDLGPTFHVVVCRRAGYDARLKGATFVAHLLTFECHTPADEPAGRRLARACVERPHRMTEIRNLKVPGVDMGDFRPGLGTYRDAMAKVRQWGPRLLFVTHGPRVDLLRPSRKVGAR